MGTPGRLLDHVGRGTLRLMDTEFLILDEADQMLDMGFKEEMEKVQANRNALGGTAWKWPSTTSALASWPGY